MKTLLTVLTLVSLTVLTAFAATEENKHETRTGQTRRHTGRRRRFRLDRRRPRRQRQGRDRRPSQNRSLLQGEGGGIPQGGSDHDHDRGRQGHRARHSKARIVRQAALAHDRPHPHRRAITSSKCRLILTLDLDTSGGDISANGLTGSVKVDTSGGDLNFGRIHGDIHADTSGGDITAKDCDGTTDLDTSGGRIEVTGGRGKLNVDTSGGNVTVLNRVGDTKVESSGGKLRLGNISGKLSAETSGGSVSAILPSPVAGDVQTGNLRRQHHGAYPAKCRPNDRRRNQRRQRAERFADFSEQLRQRFAQGNFERRRHQTRSAEQRRLDQDRLGRQKNRTAMILLDVMRRLGRETRDVSQRAGPAGATARRCNNPHSEISNQQSYERSPLCPPPTL